MKLCKAVKPPDEANRSIILEDLDSTLLVEAAAGTGKTTSMIGRMVRLLATGKCRTDTMAAVTFTRKAAAELRSRFQIELEKEVRNTHSCPKDLLSKALNNVERCFIGTIHSFCSRMLRERPVEAGVRLDFQEIDETEDQGLRFRAWNQYLTGLYADDAPILGELEDLGVEIGQLEPSFMRIANYPDVDDWPATKVSLPDPEPAKKALADLVNHMEQLLPVLPQYPGNDKLIPKYHLIPLMYRQARGFAHVYELMDILAEFKELDPVFKMWPGGASQAKYELEKWDQFRHQYAEPLVKSWKEHRYEPILRAILPAVAIYDKLREESGKLNYSDLLMRAAGLLRNNPKVREYFLKRFTHLLIDEFQDTDPVQAEVMMLLAADNPHEADWHKCRPVPGALFVVGDPKQSIYRFRRADIVTYNQVKKIITRNGGKVITLSANFRTLGPIVEWVNGSFEHEFNKFPGECSPEYVPLLRVRNDGGGSDLAGIRTLRIPAGYSTKEKIALYEADFIARTIRNAIDKGLTVHRTTSEIEAGLKTEAHPGDFLIITPKMANLTAYTRKLQDLAIPHQVTGGSAFNQASELSLLHTCLVAVTQPGNQIALLAVLRGELFGISDPDLYDYKRAKGRFSYHSEVPDSLDTTISVPFKEAFRRLQNYRRWLTEMPPVTAVEKIIADLGLDVRAAASVGGNVQAGSLLKAIELLRKAQAELWTVPDLVDYLGRLTVQREDHDAIPVLPQGDSVVRVMNLHKVKGLEAPIVFLADPTGSSNHQPIVHIDRSGRKACGYLAIEGTLWGRNRSHILAQPQDWDFYAAREKQFQDAEKLRLLYVAATRAGSLLCVSQRSSRNNQNPWAFFETLTKSFPVLDDPGTQQIPIEKKLTVFGQDFRNGGEHIRQRWESAAQKTYESVSVKSVTSQQVKFKYSVSEHGVEWGSVIHLLLETSMLHPQADLEWLAEASLSDMGIDIGLAKEAIQTVHAVTGSDIWMRAGDSEHHMVEVPFQVAVDGGVETGAKRQIMRGIIDLAFKEPAGWVIVDYKSDRVPESRLKDLVEQYGPQVRAYASAWVQLTGQKVSEAGLYFTHLQRYIQID